MKHVYLLINVILVGVIVYGLVFFQVGEPIRVSDLTVKRDSDLPYPQLRFEISNKGNQDITAIRASVNNLDLPYSFGVSEDHVHKTSKEENYNGYAAWYEPGGSIGGFNPDVGDFYWVKLTIKLIDGSTRVYNKLGIYRNRHEGAVGSIGGFDILGFLDADLLAFGSNGTLNLFLRNEWYTTYPEAVKRLELYLGDTVVWEEDVRIGFSKCFVVTVEVPFELEPEEYYDVTLIAYSTALNISNFTKPTLCQRYKIE